METPHQPVDAGVTMIIRQAKDGSHRHFEVTDDIDADGYVIALELPDDRRLSPSPASVTDLSDAHRGERPYSE